jgi:hypothetical protein
MNPVGEPDAGNRHVRFDERGWETERLPQAQATAPILDSTHMPRFCTPGPHAYCTRTPSIRPVWIGVRQLAVQRVWG